MVLLPEQPEEILSSTPLIRCLRQQLKDSSVYALIHHDLAWILEGNPNLEGVLAYQTKPEEVIAEVRELMPDYLIDLEGKKLFRRLKRKTKVLDFCIGRVKRSEANTPRERMFRTVHVFDVVDDLKGADLGIPPFNPEWLPEKFLGGFTVLSLHVPPLAKHLDEDSLVALVSLIEKPIVITGTGEERGLAERIGQRTGCTIFPVCGDFGDKEYASIISGSKGVIASTEFWCRVSEALSKPFVKIGPEIAGDLRPTAIGIRKWFE
jgi:ADP-heptose:LPS heptosyltransferase